MSDQEYRIFKLTNTPSKCGWGRSIILKKYVLEGTIEDIAEWCLENTDPDKLVEMFLDKLRKLNTE